MAVNRLLSISQDRWNEIFEVGCNDGEQTFIDFDRKTIIGKPLPFSLSGAQSALYYDKAFVANLKANMVLSELKFTKIPKSASGTIAMYQYSLNQ